MNKDKLLSATSVDEFNLNLPNTREFVENMIKENDIKPFLNLLVEMQIIMENLGIDCRFDDNKSLKWLQKTFLKHMSFDFILFCDLYCTQTKFDNYFYKKLIKYKNIRVLTSTCKKIRKDMDEAFTDIPICKDIRKGISEYCKKFVIKSYEEFESNILLDYNLITNNEIQTAYFRWILDLAILLRVYLILIDYSMVGDKGQYFACELRTKHKTINKNILKFYHMSECGIMESFCKFGQSCKDCKKKNKKNKKLMNASKLDSKESKSKLKFPNLGCKYHGECNHKH